MASGSSLNSLPGKSRLVRVFISSTFRDFIQERDELVKKVFPELRRRCKERFVELLEVDLRWGITEEQSRSGETLRVCLEEIDRCRLSAPVFFVGLLGERYGWVPPKSYFKQDVLEDPNLGWVKEHIEGKSVTELEILHGVLRNEKMREKAFFYFRKDGYQDNNWSEIQKCHAVMKPPVEVRREDFTNEGSERGKKVDDAKQRKLKQAVRDATLKWEPRDYEVPAQMASMVLEDLWKAIDQAFPARSVPNDTERRRLEHETFGQSRVAGYIPRPALFAKLDHWLTASSSAVCVVTGESGSGKSALLAAWLARLGKNAPKHCFIHYIGGTPESSTARSIVFRLLHEIREWGAVTDPVPDDFSEAVSVLTEWLRRAGEGKGGSVLLVLDALNQLENEDELGLGWLPKELPPGVRLLVSTLPGKAEDELRQRKWRGAPVEVPALEPAERRSIIEHFLREAGKNPDAIPVDKLANAPQSANALYLRVVLNELKLRASFGKVEELLDDLLEAKDPSELFVRVLKNLEELDRERPDLVRESLGYLGLARRGLTEGELLELLSDAPNPSLSPLPRHYWSPLYLALADSLVSRNGQLGFFHDYLKKAVESEYLDEDWERKEIHGRLGEVALAWNTDKFGPTLRRYGLANGAWHLRSAGYHEKLWGILRDEHFRAAQLGEFERVDEIIAGLKDGIATYCRREGQLPTDDARLAWMALQCGEVVQDAHRNLDHLLRRFLSTPSLPSDEIEVTLEHLRSLDDSQLFHACVFLVYTEAVRSKKSRTKMSIEFLETIKNELVTRTDGTIQVVPEVFNQAFAKLIPTKFRKFIQSIPQSRNNICQFFDVFSLDDVEPFMDLTSENNDEEEDAAMADDAMKLASQKNWAGALEISTQLTNVRNRSDLLFAISNAQSECGLLDEALYTFASACTQESKPSKNDWNSLGNLCFALASKDNGEKAVELSDTIKDALVRAKTKARVASLNRDECKRRSVVEFDAALKDVAGVDNSGYCADAVAVILSAINHPDILRHLQPGCEKYIEQLKYDEWRSVGFRSLADSQFRLGLLDESLRTVDKIPRLDSRAAAYASFALSCHRQGREKFAASLFDSSIKTVESCKEDHAKAEGLIVIGDCLAQVGELQRKSEWLSLAVEMGMSLPKASDAGAAMRSIALALSPLELIRVKDTLAGVAPLWRQLHMDIAFAPALTKVGQEREAHKTIEHACRMLQRIEFVMSQQHAAALLDFIIDTCGKMDFDLRVLGNVGLFVEELPLRGYDSNYRGLIQLMAKHGDYKEALSIIPAITSSSNRVKALSWLVCAITRNTQANPETLSLIRAAILSQDDWKCLLNVSWENDCGEKSAEWIRYFISLCPESSQISLKLTMDLVAALIMTDKSGAAQQICNFCPQLGLTDLLLSGN